MQWALEGLSIRFASYSDNLPRHGPPAFQTHHVLNTLYFQEGCAYASHRIWAFCIRPRDSWFTDDLVSGLSIRAWVKCSTVFPIFRENNILTKFTFRVDPGSRDVHHLQVFGDRVDF